MKARILALLLALVMVASLFAACSAGKTDASGASTGASQTTDDSKTTEDTKPAKTEKTKIVYWHAYTDQHEEKFLELAAAFNASQDEYELVAEQQPYSEIDSKTMQAVRNGTGPDLVNMYPSDAVNYLNEACRPVRLHQRPGDRHPELQGQRSCRSVQRDHPVGRRHLRLPVHHGGRGPVLQQDHVRQIWPRGPEDLDRACRMQ